MIQLRQVAPLLLPDSFFNYQKRYDRHFPLRYWQEEDSDENNSKLKTIDERQTG